MLFKGLPDTFVNMKGTFHGDIRSADPSIQVKPQTTVSRVVNLTKQFWLFPQTTSGKFWSAINLVIQIMLNQLP